MPRKAQTKKLMSQRTFKLSAKVLAALDAVCEAFDESGDRVVGKVLEDALRSLARDYRFDHVEQILGDAVRNPFSFDAAPVKTGYRTDNPYQEPYAGSAPGYTSPYPPSHPQFMQAGITSEQMFPNGSYVVAHKATIEAPLGDIILPSGGPPPPVQQETE